MFFRGPGRHFVARRGSRWKKNQANPEILTGIIQREFGLLSESGDLSLVACDSECVAQFCFHNTCRFFFWKHVLDKGRLVMRLLKSPPPYMFYIGLG